MRYGSLGEYERSNKADACESGYIGLYEGKEVCLPTPRIVSDQSGPDYKCSSVKDSCVYETLLPDGEPLQVSHPCQCGLTEQASSFCPYVYSPDYTSTLNHVTSTLLTTSKPHPCHTTERHNIYECLILNVASLDELNMLDRYIALWFE